MDGDNDVTRCNNEHGSKSISELPSCKDDLASVKPTLFQQLRRKAPANEINWKHLEGYRLPTDGKKKVSWIWKHRWRIVDGSDHEYWLCKVCHQHWYLKGCLYRTEKSTSSALDYMRIRHKLTENGLVQKNSETQTGGAKISNALFSSVSSSTRSNNPEGFAYNTLQALLYSWIVTDNVSFRKVESPRFHALLQYLNPRCKRLLPSQQTVSRTIGEIYDKQLCAITEDLGAVATKINFSFDLWTSKNRLALLGLVAHFIDSAGRSKNILLALPRQKGRHTGSNIANTVTEIICHYGLKKKVDYFVGDNVRNNSKSLGFLGTEFHFDPYCR
jgi:hypothetical protein